MARVKLLRQSLEDYNKQVNVANAEAGRRNEAYQQAYAPYAASVDQYNAGIETYNTAMSKIDRGDIFQNEAGTLKNINSKYDIVDYNPFIMGSQVSAPYKDASGNWYYDQSRVTQEAQYDSEGGLITPAVVENTKVPIELRAAHPGAAPTNAPPDPVPVEAPRAPNLTQSDIRELRTPSLDQAGMQMAANRGIIGKSELSGMDQSKISAFADPNDPNNLKEAGILARTLGGQL